MKNILRGVVVLFAVLTAAPVWAQTVSTTYIDENGTSHTVTAKVLTDTTGTFTSDTWYVVNSNVEPSSIGCEGNIKLIIADGKTLDINYGCFGGNNTTSISIYGQTHGTGKLSVNNGNFAIRASGSINITGCIVEATSDNNHAIICGIGGSTGNITINGGQVTALGGVGKGLSATGTITLGYRKKTDYISAKGFRGTVNIKSGQTLYNGATAYSGNDVGLTGSATLHPFSSNDLSINNTGTEYTIYSATGWNLFCDFLNDNDTYNRFSGKTVRLGANITVTRMAGSDYHDFCGIFDGQGHTITLDGNTTNGCYALFRNVSTGRANSTDTEDTPSAIRNLHVTGTIITASKYAAGFISGKWGNVTIENCRSSVVISSSVSGDGTHGGFVAVNNNYQLTITGCVFDGKLLTTGTTATTYCAGFVGWNESSVNISNSLYAPTNILTGETEISSECTFVRGTTPTLTNCYYTRTLGTAQGKQPRSINAGQYVTLTGVNPVGNGTTYSVSGLTAYSGGGLGHGNAFYYGVGDNVSLTLSHSNCTGYTFNNYTVTGGSIDGNTVTMPAADVTVTANLYYNLNIPAGTWQAISTPMHDEGGNYESIANVDGLTDGSYDFFRYDEGTSTWENQKIYSDFALEIGNGYLYRCSEAKTLTYHGEPNMAANYSVALSASGNSDLNGFNLVGNPYNYGITLEIPFYSINADGSWTAHNANETIAMGQAVIVHTNQDVDLIFKAAGKRAYLSNPAAKGPLSALPAMLNFENRNSIFEIQNSESLSTLFAYQNGDQLVITATGTLQAFDVMGRLLFSREVSGSKCEIPTLNFPSAGVYVLRLDGKSQKIVIK